MVLRRRNPRPLFGAAPPRNVDAIALPLGMSVAAVVALVRNFDPPFLCVIYFFDQVWKFWVFLLLGLLGLLFFGDLLGGLL